jgi:ethanolamine utilization cobalamin adenosyltransferase
LSHIEDSQAVETQFSHNQLEQLPEQLHNQQIVGLTDHSLVELVLVEHNPAGWLVHHMQGHYHKQDLETLDSHNLHCLQLAAQDNLVVQMDMTHSPQQDLAHSQLLLVHQAVQV